MHKEERPPVQLCQLVRKPLEVILRLGYFNELNWLQPR